MMDTVIEKSMQPSGSRQKDLVWNILTFLVLLGTACMVGVFSLIYVFPTHAFNPFPPAVVPPAPVLPTAAPTDIFPPTWTPTAEPDPEQTQPAQSVEQVQPSATPAPTVIIPAPAAGVTQAAEPGNGYAFEVRGDEAMVASSIIHPDAACNWIGVGGEVFDLQGAPLVGITVQMGGVLAGTRINLLSLTGTAVQYGPAGYEFALGENPVASEQSLWIQLLDQAGLPLSDKVFINTSDECQKNLILINFRHGR
jgi:hypothetical protein